MTEGETVPRRIPVMLPMLGEEERRQLVAGWNQTQVPIPSAASVCRRCCAGDKSNGG